MSKKNIAILIVAVLIVVAAGAAFWMNKTKADKSYSADGYSVVYLKTGEVYIGKLTTRPDLELTNGYILQLTKDATDPNKTNFQLNPISEALWAPASLHLIKDSVIFYGPLLPTSKIAQTLAAQKK